MNNISNELKSKIINHKYITKEELDDFINYAIYKSKVITTYMKEIKPYSRMSLFNEILWSYNVESNLYKEDNDYYCIFKVMDKEYLIDKDYKYRKI